MNDTPDHDKIIKNAQDMVTVCKFMVRIENKLDDVIKTKVSHDLFFWVVGFVIIALISLTAYAGVMNAEVVKNSTCRVTIQEQVNDLESCMKQE